MSELDQRLEEIAREPVLLVASDYDGTLAPIVDDPAEARPLREAMVALRMLAKLGQTHVGIVSGRALRELARLSQAPEQAHLIGSHGSEFDLDFAGSLPADRMRLRDRLEQELRALATQADGLLVESKPASVALHFRKADAVAAERAVFAALEGPGSLAGVSIKRGKMVVELGVVEQNKGAAIEILRHRLGATAVLYIGDDTTDEDVFATLRGPDLSIKIGDGDSIAGFRVTDCVEAARVLAQIGELRAAWLAGAEAVPIERHSLLSDQRTLALIDARGAVNWLCLPRLDAPAVFASLLGGRVAGHFTVRSTNSNEPLGQEYAGDSLVLVTRWPGFQVTDFLDTTDGRSSRRAGRSDLVRVLEGHGHARIEFAPRLDYGRVPTRLVVRGDGLEVCDTPEPMVLRAPGVAWTVHDEAGHHTAVAEVELDGAPLVLELRCGTARLRPSASAPLLRQEATREAWQRWADTLIVPSVEPVLVRRSALLLKGLCYGPTGAIAAAATTSLPEHAGGVRNWDYRYCWLRDAAMSAAALVRLGSTSEAMHFLDWVLGVVETCESPEYVQPLYGVTGDKVWNEGEISTLAGYRGSRPVRVGNAAARQVQLDVFAPIVELIALLAERDAPLSPHHWRLAEHMVHAVERRWREPDHGIWEIRKAPRHHIHSKAMCWVTIDRAVKLSDSLFERPRPEWIDLRDAIHADVMTNGFHRSVGAFTAAYECEDIDASTLLIGLCGFLDPADERYRATVAAVERKLRRGDVVYRYLGDDGLPGFEGGFILCTSWLVSAYLATGRRDEAEALFRALVAQAGPTGLLSEEYDPERGIALGNVPQAYSHIGLITNALELAAAGG